MPAVCRGRQTTVIRTFCPVVPASGRPSTVLSSSPFRRAPVPFQTG